MLILMFIYTLCFLLLKFFLEVALFLFALFSIYIFLIFFFPNAQTALSMSSNYISKYKSMSDKLLHPQFTLEELALALCVAGSGLGRLLSQCDANMASIDIHLLPC